VIKSATYSYSSCECDIERVRARWGWAIPIPRNRAGAGAPTQNPFELVPCPQRVGKRADRSDYEHINSMSSTYHLLAPQICTS